MRRLSRRDFLKIAGMGIGTLLLPNLSYKRDGGYDEQSALAKESYIESLMDGFFYPNIDSWNGKNDFPVNGATVGCQSHEISFENGQAFRNCVYLAKGFVDILGNPASGYVPKELALPRVGIASFNGGFGFKGFERGEYVPDIGHVIPVVYNNFPVSMPDSVHLIEPNKHIKVPGSYNFTLSGNHNPLVEFYLFDETSQALDSIGGYCLKGDNTYEYISQEELSFYYQISYGALDYYMSSHIYRNPEKYQADLSAFTPQDIERLLNKPLTAELYDNWQLSWALENARYPQH